MRSYAPGMLASAGHTGIAPAHLLDVLTVNGEIFYWSDRNKIQAPPVLTQPDTITRGIYLPWLVGVPTITQYRSMQTNTGSFAIQNVSGDTLASDLETMLRSTTLEGAQFAYRMWVPGMQRPWLSWYGTLTLDATAVADGQFKAKDMFDPNATDALDEQYCETCQWLWGSDRCGVVIASSGGTTADVTEAAITHSAAHAGLVTITGTKMFPYLLPVGGPGDPGDPGGGGGDGGTGGGGGTGSPGNPGGGGGGGTVTSAVECDYSYQSCQVRERFSGVLNHFEKNYGETLMQMTGSPIVRSRRV